MPDEALLAAQGINPFQVNLLGSTYRQLNNRAGNSMSETVAGAILMSVLVFQFKLDDGKTHMEHGM